MAGTHTRQGSISGMLLTLACISLLLMGSLGYLLVPDQVRDVPEPPDLVATLSKSLETKPNVAAEPDGPVTASVRAITPEPVCEGCPIVNESKLPREFLEPARQHVRKVKDLVSRLHALAGGSTKGSYEADVEEAMSIHKAYNDAFYDFQRATGAPSLSIDMQQRVKDGIEPNLVQFLGMLNQTQLAIAVSHQRWDKAARICEGLGRGNMPGASWDQEVYYLRKAGWRGRVSIAIRSAERIAENMGTSMIGKSQ